MNDAAMMASKQLIEATRALPAQPNNSLISGIECLSQVVGANGPIGSREVARRMEMTHTRVNRLLGTLSYMGLLDQDGDRRYRPGPGLHALAAQSMMASGLLSRALPHVLQLTRQAFTVALGTLWQGKVCFLFHERPGQALEDAILRHELWPAGRSTIGIALLAAKPGVQLDGYEDGDAQGLRPRETLKESVALARERGFAQLHFDDGTVSVGVVIGTPAIAALAVSRQHIGDEFIPEIARQLQSAADAITRDMGLKS